jgi:hypothetical protein
MVAMTLNEHSYLTKESLWRELDALGEHQVRLRLAQGAYPDRTRVLVEEWLRELPQRRVVVQDAYKVPPSTGYVAPPTAAYVEPVRVERIERREDNKMTVVAATAAGIAAFMATVAATVAVLIALQPV